MANDSETSAPGETEATGHERAPTLGEPLRVYAAIAGATLAIEVAGRMAGLADYTHVALAAVFLGVSVRGAQRGPGGLRGHGLWLGGLLEGQGSPSVLGEVRDLLTGLKQAAPSALRESLVALALSLVIFPPFVLGFVAFHQPARPFQLLLPDHPLDVIAAQLLVVALPEEAFFRGYLQSRLALVFRSRVLPLGIRVSPGALLLQAALFALLHFLVQPHPARLAVFFPGLLFGLLRAARGGIGAAIVFHALCNLLSDLLVRGFL